MTSRLGGMHSDLVTDAIKKYRSGRSHASNIKFPLKILIILSIYCALGVLMPQDLSLLEKPCIVMAMGFILAGFLNLAHECLHQNIFKSKHTNYLIGSIAAGILLINYTAYTDKHLKHHQHLGTSNDTESSGEFNSVSSYFFTLSGCSFLISQIRLGVEIIFFKFPAYMRGRKRMSLARREAWGITLWIVVVLVLLTLFPKNTLSLYLAPLAVAYFWIIFIGLPEHYGCSATVPRYLCARTITSNWVVRYFMWNANFHAEHHRYPAAPSSLLETIALEEMGQAVYRERSYARWHLNLIRSLMRHK